MKSETFVRETAGLFHAILSKERWAFPSHFTLINR